MKTGIARRLALPSILAACLAATPFAWAQYSTEAVVLGTAGYVMNFEVQWSCDDAPSGTVSAPGEVQLVDSGGNTVATVFATANGMTPVVTVTGAGSVTGVTSSIHIEGAGGTPADGLLHGSWLISGPPAGSYSLRLWLLSRSAAGKSASTITTDTRDAGGGGPLYAPTPTPSPTPSPTPTPTPTPSPSPTPTPTPVPPAPQVSITAPASTTVFQAAGLGAAATVLAGGRPLVSVRVDISLDGGSTWASVVADSHPTSPSDSEGTSYAFGSTGAALVRATAVDAGGLAATATQTVTIVRASQPLIAITPATATTVAGQGVAFTASGGATGNYLWGGSAAGGGASQAVVFQTVGDYAVTVLDQGNANYGPSPVATATVTVQSPFFTLSAAATSGGTVTGGGSYPANAQATAAAAAAPGNTFAGWTGDVTAATPAITVTMNSNKSVTAHFSPLLAQVITFVNPGAVTTRTPAFNLSVSASSGLPVSLVLNSGPAALAGNLVTPAGSAGQVVVTAAQAGNSQYLPAAPVVISFAIGAAPAGVVLSDDSASTKKSDKATPNTSYTSGAAH